ncbi:hypothetical protein AA313_de0203221 [Arthrobotrys entomopaga]|nr:hypothetical protein AA313_de0203221 [Arthrobotrys entomopaga]
MPDFIFTPNVFPILVNVQTIMNFCASTSAIYTNCKCYWLPLLTISGSASKHTTGGSDDERTMSHVAFLMQYPSQLGVGELLKVFVLVFVLNWLLEVAAIVK